MILKAAFGDPDQVGTALAELNKLSQGNKEFSQYYAEFQYLMIILNYDTNVKKATHKQGLSHKLQASLVYQAEEPKDFTKFVDLCIKLDYWIHAHTTAMKCQTTSVPICPSPIASHPSAHLTITNRKLWNSPHRPLSFPKGPKPMPM